MARRLSRRRVADYVATALLANDVAVLKKLAAYLIETRQTNNFDLFVRDIETVLASKGHVIGDVTSAFSLADATRKEIDAFIKNQTGATSVQLRERVDPTVLGGFRLRIPGQEHDTTVARQLTTLRTRFKKA